MQHSILHPNWVEVERGLLWYAIMEPQKFEIGILLKYFENFFNFQNKSCLYFFKSTDMNKRRACKISAIVLENLFFCTYTRKSENLFILTTSIRSCFPVYMANFATALVCQMFMGETGKGSPIKGDGITSKNIIVCTETTWFELFFFISKAFIRKVFLRLCLIKFIAF